MLDDRMVTKKGAKLSRKPKTTPASTFAEIGRHAAREAQRRAILAAATAHGWNLSAVAAALQMGDASAVIRALKALAPDEYEAAKAAGKVAPGRR